MLEIEPVSGQITRGIRSSWEKGRMTAIESISREDTEARQPTLPGDIHRHDSISGTNKRQTCNKMCYHNTAFFFPLDVYNEWLQKSVIIVAILLPPCFPRIYSSFNIM